MKEEMLELTSRMVAISSVNTTSGEKEIGIFIENYLRNIPYFAEHPDNIIVQKLKGDKLDRRNVFALLRGEKDKNPDTIIFHGHTDTVGVEDYGELKKYAFDTKKLARELHKINLPEDVKKDLESGEYLFGRGSCDMKSGDAVFMVLIKHIAENIEDFSGNILLSLNPVEENLHTGIIEGIDMLEQIKEQHGLNYILAINNDYTCPMYPGDTHQYIYTGVGGKLLPCFYIQGRETHVGQCFEGYDPTTIAADITSYINLNTKFSDGYHGEYSLPPVSLKLKDLKEWYNVQTAKEAFVYFNYFVHNEETKSIVKKLLDAAYESVDKTMNSVNERYKEFCELTGKNYIPIKNQWTVITYEKLYETAIKKCPDIDGELSRKTEELLQKNVDKREIPIYLIRMMIAKAQIYHPVIVLYFAAPYCPHNILKDDKDKELIEKLKKVAK